MTRASWLILAAALPFTVFGTDVALAAGCGSHGGPGYRGPNGRCVGWGNLTAICGDPPATRCTLDGHKPPSPSSVAPGHADVARTPPPVAPPTAASASPHPGPAMPLNPAVTQATIGSTICVPGWTATVRPPASYTNSIKVRLMRAEGLPLELSLSAPRRRRPLEKCLARAVCAGRVRLDEARRRIWLDWREAGKACY